MTIIQEIIAINKKLEKKNSVPMAVFLDAKIKQLRESLNNLQPANIPIIKNNLKVVSEFYRNVYQCYAVHKSPADLTQLLDEAMDYSFLEFFKIAVTRQISIMRFILQENPVICRLYTDLFVTNLFLITNKIQQISRPESLFFKTRVLEYINDFYEYLGDYGWLVEHYDSPATAKGNLVEIFCKANGKVNYLERAMPMRHAKERQLLRNMQGLKHFYSEIKKCNPDEPLQLTSLESILAFCEKLAVNKLGYLVNDDKMDLLIAIKSNNLTKVKEIVMLDPWIISRNFGECAPADEMGFTPLMFAAKYSKTAKMLDEGLFFPHKNRLDKIKHIHVRTQSSDKFFDAYNSLMIAARWGSDSVFVYLLDLMAGYVKNDPGAALTLLNCICHTYFKVPEANASFTQLASILKFNNFKNDNVFAYIADHIPNLVRGGACTSLMRLNGVVDSYLQVAQTNNYFMGLIDLIKYGSRIKHEVILAESIFTDSAQNKMTALLKLRLENEICKTPTSVIVNNKKRGREEGSIANEETRQPKTQSQALSTHVFSLFGAGNKQDIPTQNNKRQKGFSYNA